ncbi:MAG: IMS domain-containing protein [Chloroflexota bacterium]|nr:IMS domain-containing protein [Chloroflexota bacterium]
MGENKQAVFWVGLLIVVILISMEWRISELNIGPLVLQPPNNSEAPTSSSQIIFTSETISQAEIEELIERWDIIHEEADRNWDLSQLDTVLYGAALQQQTDTVNGLIRDNCYWTITELEPSRIEKFDYVDSTTIKVKVYKNWDMDKFCNGVKTGDEDGYFFALYDIKKINDHWLITYKDFDHE